MQTAADRSEALSRQQEDLPLHVQFDDLCAQAVLNGKASAFFREAMEYIKAYSDFDGFSDREQQEIRRDMAELVKRRLAVAIKKTQKHCGQPVEVSASYNFESGRHSLFVRCSCCNKSMLIKEIQDEDVVH